jgi:PAS domain S-box-containing protein
VAKTGAQSPKRAASHAAVVRFLSERANDLLWYVDPEGNVRTALGAFETVLGFPPKALCDHSEIWKKVVHPEDQPQVLPALTNPAAHLRGKELVFRTVLSDGLTTRCLAVRFEPHHDDGGRLLGVACIARDLTEIRSLADHLDRASEGLENLDRSLQDSRQQLETLFQGAGEAIFILEPQTLRILEHNQRAEDLTNYTSDQLSAMSFGHLLTEPDAESLRRHLSDLGRADSVPSWRGRAVPRGGQVFEIEVQASHVELASRSVIECFVRDITERLDAEKNILRVEQILRGISDSTVVFDLEGRVTFANAAAQALWGHARSAWPTLTVWDLHSSSVPIERGQGEIILDGGREHAEGEFRLRRADGEERDCFTSFSLVRETRGEPIGLVAISRDVTGDKALQQQMLQVQKMDSIGTLAGGVAHEFNNMIGGILGHAQLIRQGEDERSATFSRAELIERSALRASKLTKQLLSFSRRGVYNLRVTTINDVVQGALMLLEGTLPKSIVMHTDLDPDPGRIEADLTQLEQVIINLCINARDAMGQGGWISVRTRTRELDEAFCRDHVGMSPGPHVELTVKDTGDGISEENLPHIFEPFFTTKDVGKGTGLGLSVVYGIVKNHRGFIDVTSKTGVGTQFVVHLPVTQRALTQIEEVAPAATGGNEHILVVDDEQSIREVATDLLTSFGYSVLLAKDGIEAIEVFRGNRSIISLVLLDMQMPGLNGLLTHRRLREIDPAVRVILSSGYGLDSDIQGGLEEGVLAFIQKPYEVNELARLVRQCLDKAPAV